VENPKEEMLITLDPIDFYCKDKGTFFKTSSFCVHRKKQGKSYSFGRTWRWHF